MGECGLGFSTDTGKSRMTRHTPLYLLALTLCLVVLFIDTASAEFFEDGDGDLVDDTLATNKRAWNSNFNGGIGKRSWNNRFTGGIGKRAASKRAWNSHFSGGLGKRAETGYLHE